MSHNEAYTRLTLYALAAHITLLALFAFIAYLAAPGASTVVAQQAWTPTVLREDSHDRAAA